MLIDVLIGKSLNQFAPYPKLTDCVSVATLALALNERPLPRTFESCHLTKSANGKSSGSETPLNVTPNSIDVVDCSSTEIIKSTRFSSEPGTTSGTTALKYCKLYKFRKPVVTFAFEKISPDSIGNSRLITWSFVFVLPLIRTFST